jgi:hypothetical protein
MANWFIWRKGWEEGPITSADLRSRVNAGVLKPTDRVRREHMTDYVEAKLIKGLFVKPASSRNQVSQEMTNSSSTSSPPTNTTTVLSSDPAQSTSNQATSNTNSSDDGCSTGCVSLLIIGGLLYFGLNCFGISLNPFQSRRPTRAVPSTPVTGGNVVQQDESRQQLADLNTKIEEWKTKREKLSGLLSNLSRDKSSLVTQLKQLGAGPTNQKSDDPKVSILLLELREVLKQLTVFERKHNDYDLAIFKSESRVRTFERRISAEEVADNDEELTGLIRSMAELDQTLDSENQAEVPIELDSLIKEALSGSGN